MNKISFYTLGCRLNQSETAVIERTFESVGYRIVDFQEPADVVVINTCTVTENGDADTRRLVNKVNRINPKARIALVGCQAQVQREQLTKLPNVRWVVGNARKMDIVHILKDADLDAPPEVITPPIGKDSFTIPMAGIDRKHTRVNIKIQDGCDFFCSFCEIPYARGRARSRVFEDISKEATILAAAGHKELVITGINVGTYGYKGFTLMDVIESLEQISGVERIRISSIEPTTIPEKLIAKMAGRTKLCRHLHIPLQSSQDVILKSMKRNYTFDQFKDWITAAHAAIPQICLGTDIIVGFPGETESLFEGAVRQIKDLPMQYFHVFSYSKRNMAKGRKLAGEVPSSLISQRSKILRTLSQRKRHLFYSSLCGTTQNVLFEQQKKGAWTGLTDNYVRVNVLAAQDLTNKVCPVEFQKILDDNVEGILK